ncbi:penicillin-binding protein 1A [Bacteroidia bacterium]|nr:penicillin-binding protein 1A [Bacteroidia bacterium]GHT26281.1 penicillin-binding protein 1A [Bacteroidia bacterium]
MKKNSLAKKIVVGAWSIFTLGILFAGLMFYLIAQGKIGYMPPIEDLENPINKYASQVLSVDLKQLGTYAQSNENRVNVNYNELSPAIIQALIATEDIRFYEHSGIDVYALFRAVVKRGILLQKSGGGGSTISQQLAKLLYSEHAGSLMERLLQKPVEWVIAVQLERYYTKEEIISLYLNKFDFLYNAVGIQTACWVYFGKLPKDISVEEAATLIGMCKNPSYFNPIRHIERTTGRRNVVLSLMESNNFISKAECISLQAKPLVTRFNKVDHKDGLAPYFREYLRLVLTAKKPDKKDYRGWQMQKFSEDSLAWETNPLYGWCNKNKKVDDSNFNLYTDGLKIYTTIDSRMQTYAEEAVTEHLGGFLQDAFFKEKKGSKTAPFSRDLKQDEVAKIMERAIEQTDRYRNLKKENKSDSEIKTIFNTPVDMTVFSWKGAKDTIMSPRDSILYMKSFMRAGFMAMDPRTGAVKAYVGGPNFQYFQYDMINTGKRQIGSTIKPFLYSLAMESGMTPCDEMLHVEQHLVDENGIPWIPKNANQKRIGEMVNIRWGLQNSDNWVTAWIMKQLNPYTFANLLHSYGLKNKIDPVISLCLGSCDASIGEMVSGYTTFANKGIHIDPIYVTRIEDINGNILATFSPNPREIINEDAAYKMLSMLRDVVDGGTGNRIRRDYGITVPMGGKTGTTDNHSDGWFMGFTPSLVGGAWVGGEERSIHFDRMSEGQGATMALPIFGKFLKKVLENTQLGYSSAEQFEVSGKYSDPCSSYSETEELFNSATGIDDIFD